MAISSADAKKLLTASEYDLFRQSGATEIRKHTAARLKQKVQRARRLRDKYRDLARQQRGEARGKRAAKSTRPAAGNARTKQKVEIFVLVLERFQKRLEKVEADARRAEEKKKREAERKKKAAAKAARAAKKRLQKGAAKKKSSKSGATAGAAGGPAGTRKPRSSRAGAAMSSRVRATRGQYRAAGRRSQARRDRRR